MIGHVQRQLRHLSRRVPDPRHHPRKVLLEVFPATGPVPPDDPCRLSRPENQRAFEIGPGRDEEALERACAEVSRDPATLRRSIDLFSVTAAGSPEKAAEGLLRYATLGFDEVRCDLNPEADKSQLDAIDWKEFEDVLKGNGPCNRERLETRRRAHDDGRWVREAALAYAEKQRARQAQAA